MAAQTDLWGDLEVTEFRTPLAILKEQASLLGQKTKNLVEAKVDTTTGHDGDFYHTFLLVAPTLDNYIYKLFTVSHPIGVYPLKVGPGSWTKDEAEFTAWLRLKLSSAETKRIIGHLLAQATS